MHQDNPVFRRIHQAASQGKLSHAMLFTGEGDLLGAARYAAAALECTAQGQKPCGVCAACRKVAQDIHPDVITVRDPEHKTIAVEMIREIRSDAHIIPNEGARKVYIFPDCDLLTPRDQNVLLKTVEEGPPYAAFLFCAQNASAVLQTLRSRCVEMKLAQETAQENRVEEDASHEQLCRALAAARRGAVAELCARWEKGRMDRQTLSAMLESSRRLLVQALALQYGKAPESDLKIVEHLAKTLTNRQIMRTIEVLETYRKASAFNIGVGHALGALAVELEELL